MRVSAIFTVFTLLLISSVFANKVGDEQGVCKDIFVDHEIKDAFECINAHQSTLTNLTKPDGKYLYSPILLLHVYRRIVITRTDEFARRTV